MKRLVVLLALVGCSAADPVSAPVERPGPLDFSAAPIGDRPFDHGSIVTAVAFSPRGDRIATGTVAGLVRVFDRRGALLERRDRHTSGIAKLAFLEDGTLVSEDFGGAIHDGGVSFVGTAGRAFATNGRRVVYADSASIAVVDSGEIVARVMEGSSGPIALSPNGALLAYSPPRGLSVRELATGRERLIFRELCPSGVDFLPDGRLIVGTTGGLIAFDAFPGRRLENLDGSDARPVIALGPAVSFAVSPDGALARANDRGDQLRVTIDRPETPSVDVALPGGWAHLAFSPDGRLLAVGRAFGVDLVDARTGQILTGSATHRDRVCALGFAKGGKSLVSVGADGRVTEWSVETRLGLRSVALPYRTRAGAVSESGQALILTESGRILDVFTGSEFDAPHARHCALSPGGRLVATASTDELVVRDLASGVELRKWSIAAGRDVRVLFSDDGAEVATCSCGEVHRFDMETGARAPGNLRWLHATQGEGNATIEPQGVLLDPPGRDWGVFSPRGDLVALLGTTEVPVHDARTGRRVATLEGRHREITALAFSPDERLIATGDISGAIVLWERRP